MKNPITLLILGAVIGAAAGILMAPEKGSATRRKIFEGAEDLADELKEKIKASNKKIDEYAEVAEDAIDKLNRKIKAAEKAYT